MKKFPAVHTISSMFKIMSWIVGIATVIVFVLSIFQSTRHGFGSGFLTGLLGVLAGGFFVLILYATAEGILVILAIEENTRKEKTEAKGKDTEVLKKTFEGKDPAGTPLREGFKKKEEDDFLKY